MQDNMNLQGVVTLQLYGPDGELKQEVTKHNLIVNSGRSRTIALISGAAVGAPNWVAIGSDNSAAHVTQTAMLAQLASASAVANNTTSAYESRLSVTFASGVGTGSITEVGRQCAASTDLVARTILSGGDVVNKGASDSLVATYTLTYASG
jgi:hypothetical protein